MFHALHWRMLTAAVALTMAAMMFLPPFLPAPDLDEKRELAGLGDGAEAYVADRFPARAQLIAGANALRLPFGVTGSARVVVGRQGWLYYDDGTHLGGARGEPAMSLRQERTWLAGLAARSQALAAQGVPYLVVAAPAKETIYPQYGPSWFHGPSPDRPSRRLAALAQDTGAAEVLHLQGALAAATRAGLKTYSRHDTHWTGAGAYAGYVALVKRLNALGVVAEPPRLISDFAPDGAYPDRDLALMLGVAGLVRLDHAGLTDPARAAGDKVTYLTRRTGWAAPRVVDTGLAGKPTALITVDSFSNALLPLLYGHFSRVIVTHNQDGAWRPDLVARFRPDVVILEVQEHGLPSVMDPSPTPSAEAALRIDAMLAQAARQPGGLIPDRFSPADPEGAMVTDLAAAKAARECNPETAGLRDGELALMGWIVDRGRDPGGQGLARLTGPGGDFLAPLAFDRPRRDVARRHPGARGDLGYRQGLALAEVPPGAYALRVYRRGAAGWIACPAGREITVP